MSARQARAARVAEIGRLQASGMNAKQIAQHFGVTEGAIRQYGGYKTAPCVQPIGHSVYVAEFTNGLIKVGYGADPSVRVKAHLRSARVAGCSARRVFAVRCAGNAFVAEHALIQGCIPVAARRYGYEWFEGLDFSAACRIALAAAKWPTPEPATTTKGA